MKLIARDAAPELRGELIWRSTPRPHARVLTRVRNGDGPHVDTRCTIAPLIEAAREDSDLNEIVRIKFEFRDEK